MGYQSESQFELQLIKKPGTLSYEYVVNFREELNLFNKDALENRDISGISGGNKRICQK